MVTQNDHGVAGGLAGLAASAEDSAERRLEHGPRDGLQGLPGRAAGAPPGKQAGQQQFHEGTGAANYVRGHGPLAAESQPTGS